MPCSASLHSLWHYFWQSWCEHRLVPLHRPDYRSVVQLLQPRTQQRLPGADANTVPSATDVSPDLSVRVLRNENSARDCYVWPERWTRQNPHCVVCLELRLECRTFKLRC